MSDELLRKVLFPEIADDAYMPTVVTTTEMARMKNTPGEIMAEVLNGKRSLGLDTIAKYVVAMIVEYENQPNDRLRMKKLKERRMLLPFVEALGKTLERKATETIVAKQDILLARMDAAEKHGKAVRQKKS